MRRAAIACIVVALGACWCAKSARGDADPPSDVLIGADAYYPYTPVVPAPLKASLDGLLRKSRARGHVYKVALIASPADLGAATVLYGKSQRYATFLFGEIKSYLARQSPTLIVVTGTGLAVRGRDATALGRAALFRLAPQSNPTAARLAQEALQAVESVARANGHPLPKVTYVSARQHASHSGRIALLFALAAMLAAGVSAAVFLRQRGHCVATGGAG